MPGPLTSDVSVQSCWTGTREPSPLICVMVSGTLLLCMTTSETRSFQNNVVDSRPPCAKYHSPLRSRLLDLNGSRLGLFSVIACPAPFAVTVGDNWVSVGRDIVREATKRTMKSCRTSYFRLRLGSTSL